ncbi:hypothetical protein [Methanosarcina siciliae]|uniref:hypothetical protein n=1 Tax=Methanosarcina siciliae TaxID=38027 RepID=UPI00064EACB4|nr:hypothetical protein [Methanosarcina siciliae]
MIKHILDQMIAEKPNKNEMSLTLFFGLKDGKQISCNDVEDYQITSSSPGVPQWIIIKSKSGQMTEVDAVKVEEIYKIRAHFTKKLTTT